MVRSKAPAAKKKPTRGVDFKKYKRKLGRKLPPPNNATNTEIKSKAIVLPEQSIASDKAGLALSKKGQSLKELLQHTSHHNVKVRRDALVGIREILLKDPTELKDHKLAIIEKLRERINDDDKVVRETLYQLFQSIILPGCKEDNQGAIMTLVLAYIFNAMTHLALDVRLTAFRFFDLVIQNAPSVFSSHAEKVLDNYMDILQKIHFHIEDKSKLKTVLSGLLRCLSLLPSNQIDVHPFDQETGERLVLHAFEVDLPKESTGHFKVGGKLKDLMELLVTCFNGLLSVVHSQQVLDSHAFDCMLSLLQSIYLVVQYHVDGISKFQKNVGTSMSSSPLGIFLHDQDFYFSVLDKLFTNFPILSVDFVSEKDDQRYFILNTVTSQIHFTFRQWICPVLCSPDKFLDFLVDALTKVYGGVQKHKALHEKHLVSLVPFIPRLLATVDWSQRHGLLQAFTAAFRNCYTDSPMKMACLKAVEELLASEEDTLYFDAGDMMVLDYQKAWINEIGLLLNAFGKEQPSKLHEILQLLVRLGQIGLRNSELVKEYDRLQDELQNFYGLRTEKGDRCYGPFLELPEDCQFLSICCLSYFDHLKGGLLSSLALCCLSDSLNLSVLTRILEVIQSSYKAGHVSIEDYISFCITLLSQYEADSEQTSATPEKEALSSHQKTFRYVTSVILSFFNQMGDQSILLHIIENIVLAIMSQELPVENTCALMRLLVEVDSKPTKLSEKSIIKLGDIISSYMVDVAALFPEHDKERIGLESSCTCRYYFIPCFCLLDRSSILMKHLLVKLGSFIAESCELPYLRASHVTQDFPSKIKAIVCLMSIMSMDPKMPRVISSCKSEMDNILHSVLSLQSSDVDNMNIEQRHKVEHTVEILKSVIRQISRMSAH